MDSKKWEFSRNLLLGEGKGLGHRGTCLLDRDFARSRELRPPHRTRLKQTVTVSGGWGDVPILDLLFKLYPHFRIQKTDLGALQDLSVPFLSELPFSAFHLV